jgi:segregation and condensation protein B
MDETATKNVVEAALLAAGQPLSFDKLVEIFTRKGVDVDRATVRGALTALATDYEQRAIELKETASGYRVQVRSSSRDWLEPLFEERAPRYTRALLETLALVAYRQPITRAEIEEVRGVAVSTNIIRTLLERGWVRVVGYRDVPGKPSMLGTTKEFLDYFGLKKLDDLPPLSEIRELMLEANPQSDFVEALHDAVSLREDGGATAAVAGEELSEIPEDVVDSDEGAEAGAAAEAEATEAGPEPESEPERDTGLEPESELESEAETDTESELESEAESDTEFEPESELEHAPQHPDSNAAENTSDSEHDNVIPLTQSETN